jgi:hypothetical protein
MNAVPHDERGSSLPELLVAAGLGVVALTVLAMGLLGPVLTLDVNTRSDPRADQLEVVRLELQRIVRTARPGLDAPAVRAIGQNAVEVRLGDLVAGALVQISLDDDGLRIDDGSTVRHLPVSGLDLARSHLRPIDHVGAAVDPLRPADAVAVHVVLHVRAEDPDGGPGAAPRWLRAQGEVRSEQVVGLRMTGVLEEVVR